MTDLAVFQGSLVNLKNSPTHKSVILQVEIPEEYGEAIVRAFGWPTRVKPLAVAVARLEGADEQARTPKAKPEPRRFNELSYAEQAGILCKDPEFADYLRSSFPYRSVADLREGSHAEDLVKELCGVTSRAYIKEDNEAGRRWSNLVKDYRRWQDERNRQDVDF